MSTLAQLRQRVRYNVGEPTSSANGRFYDVSINNNLNEAYRQYQEDWINNGEGALVTRATIDLVANQEAYALPSDWVRTERIERQLTFGTKPLDKYERYETSNVTISSNSGDWFLPTYRFRNQSIIFEPYPTFSQTAGMIHEYYALQSTLAVDGDSPVSGFLESWQDMCVIWATIAELEIKDAVGGTSDANAWRARLEAMEERFRKTMYRRTEQRDCVEPYGINYNDQDWNY